MLVTWATTHVRQPPHQVPPPPGHRTFIWRTHLSLPPVRSDISRMMVGLKKPCQHNPVPISGPSTGNRTPPTTIYHHCT